MEEIRKDIPGYEGVYQASSLGNIKSLARFVNKTKTVKRFVRERILKLIIKRDGYVKVKLCGKSLNVHRLIALTFLGKSNGLEVNHKNKIRDDNKINNLEYLTKKNNQIHAYLNGRRGTMQGKTNSEHNTSKLCIVYYDNGEKKTFGSVRECYKYFNFSSKRAILNIKGVKEILTYKK